MIEKLKFNKIQINLNEIVEHATKLRASDIHIEEYEFLAKIRLRIDGVVHNFCEINKAECWKIISKIKVLSKLDITEKRLPQNGSFKINIFHNNKNIRVGTCPTIYGEKVVLRILNSEEDIIPIDKLGMEKFHLEIFSKYLKKPQGLILITGPTGSGKTTTIYSILKLLMEKGLNIVTAEDPAEIKIFGINQTQINKNLNLSYNNVIPVFLRQDPDVIFIGEIRDKESAKAAIEASETGHLVISTMHCKLASNVISRFKTLGIKEKCYLQNIKTIINQRLIRKLCSNCKKYDELSKSFIAKGCNNCLNGYKGRIGSFELFIPFRKNPIKYPLYSSLLNKINQGITSLNEVKKVI